MVSKIINYDIAGRATLIERIEELEKALKTIVLISVKARTFADPPTQILEVAKQALAEYK